MNSIVSSILLCLLSIIVLFLTILIFHFIKSCFKYLTTKYMYSHLPRNSATFAMFNLFREDGIKHLLNTIVDKNGNLQTNSEFVGPHLDGTPTCFVYDADNFRDLFIEKKFPKLKLAYDPLKVVLGNGLVTSTGEIWKKERRLLTPLFHFAKLKQMPDIMNNRIEKFIKLLKNKHGENLTPSVLFGTLTLEIVIDCVFGGEHYLSAEIMDGLWETTNKAILNYFLTDLLLGSTMNKLIPFPWNLKLYSSINKIKNLVDNAIRIKQEEIKIESEREYDSDLLASLLRVKDNETGNSIPIELIRDESLTFLFAGHDTTSSLLSWCMTFLANHPEVVAKIREESNKILGNRSTPEFSDISKFTYTEMVLKETLRMRPPVPLVDREVSRDIKLGDYTYKAGTAIYPIMIAAHFDNRFWNNPFEFNPDRFASEEEATRHAFSFIPFSVGTRNCIGRKFAMMEATLILVQLLRQFDIKATQKAEDVAWIFEGTMKPSHFTCNFVPI